MIEPSSIDLSIESRYENVALVGWSVHKIALEAGLDDVGAYQVEVCIVEAVNNSIKHAYGERAGERVEISLRVDPAKLAVRIRDTGAPMPEHPAPDLSAEPTEDELMAENGRGLLIMHAFMDEVHYGRDGAYNELTLVRRLGTIEGAEPLCALGSC